MQTAALTVVTRLRIPVATDGHETGSGVEEACPACAPEENTPL